MQPSRYNYIMQLYDGTLGIYNTAANRIAFFESKEWEKLLRKGDGCVPKGKCEYFFVDDDANELEDVLALEQAAISTDFKVRIYDVLTTTACNARCGYCYESSWQARSLNMETAQKILECISRESMGAEEICIQWLGGEPLLAMEPIRCILNGLQGREPGGVTSALITNGSLIDTACADELRALGFGSVQVTVDGIGENYDQKKRYCGIPPNSQEIHSNSPFEGLVHSIDLLIDRGIKVQARVNVGKGELNLVEETLRYFEGRYDNESLSLYFAPIDSLTERGCGISNEKDLRSFYARVVPAWAKWRKAKTPEDLLYPHLTTHCGACVPYARTFFPDGSIGKCHRDPRTVFGDVLSDASCEESGVYYDFKHPEDCLNCIFLPKCHGGCRYKSINADYALAKCCSLRFDIDARIEVARSLL